MVKWSSAQTNTRLSCLTVVDAYTRECLALEVDTSFARKSPSNVRWTLVSTPHGVNACVIRGILVRHVNVWEPETADQEVGVYVFGPQLGRILRNQLSRRWNECLVLNDEGNLGGGDDSTRRYNYGRADAGRGDGAAADENCFN
jgi:hypothetical protein